MVGIVTLPEHTTNLDAAYLELSRRHADLVRQLQRLATETQHQVDRLTLGDYFQVTKLSRRVQAVNEARKLHLAAAECVGKLDRRAVNQ